MKREISDDDELVDFGSTGIAMASISLLSSGSPSSNPKNATALIRAESSTVTQLKDLGVMEDDGCVLQKECRRGNCSSTAELSAAAYAGKPKPNCFSNIMMNNNENNNIAWDDEQNRSNLYRNPGRCSKNGCSANSVAMAQVRNRCARQGSEMVDLKNNFADPPRLPPADRNESSGTSGVVEGEKMAGKKGNSALYGLRRNPKRSRKFFNQTSTAPPKKTNSIFSEKARACTECGKEFSSWKALFGHMRCHPEREWRGILPPQGVRHERDQHHIQQPQQRHQVQRAQVQAIHRKKPNLPRPQLLADDSGSELEDRIVSYKLPDGDSETESIETAYLNGTGPDAPNGREAAERRSKPIHKPRLKISVEDCAIKTSTGESEKEPADCITTPTEIMEQRDMAHCLVMLSSAGRTENESAFSDNRDDNAADDRAESTESAKLQWQASASPTNHHQQQQQQSQSQAGEEDSAVRFECGTCKKVFRSHQALGGHRASHKKVKGCFAITNENQPEDAPIPATQEVLNPEDCNQRNDIYKEINSAASPADHDDHAVIGPAAKKNKGGGNHQCTICFRVFSTGQALGGHKRCHWGAGESANKDAAPPEHYLNPNPVTRHVSVSSNLYQAQQQRPPSKSIKADLLDLNLPAPAEDDAADQSKHAMSARTDELELRLGNALDPKRAGQFPYPPES